MTERTQATRVARVLLGDLTLEQKNSVKDQMGQMMPLFMKLDQLLPVFYALTNNAEATIRLIRMKFMFEDQLESLKLDQYTITPDNLVKLKDHLQRYFLWVRMEIANTTPQTQNSLPQNGPPQNPPPGAMNNLNQQGAQVNGTQGQVSGAQVPGAQGPGTLPGTQPGVVQNSVPVVNNVPDAKVTNQNAPVLPVPSTAPAAGIQVKHGLTTADLKLPPPRKTNNSPPNMNFPASPRSDAGTPTAAVTPNMAQRSGPTTNPKQTKAPGADQSPVATNTTDTSVPAPDANANLTSSQLMMRARMMQAQAQQQGTAQPPTTQTLASLPAVVATQGQAPAVTPNTPTRPALNPQAAVVANSLESLTREELLHQLSVFQRALSSNSVPSNQMVRVRMQLQRIQSELVKPHRQEQARAAQGAIGSGPAVTTASPPVPPVSTGESEKSEAPQIKELHIQETRTVAPSQLLDPLEILTASYKTLVGVNDAGTLRDEGVAREGAFMLHNAFEGFVGKRVGNGPGKDMYEERAPKRQRRELKDDAIADLLLWNDDGQPDAFIASYGDWATKLLSSA
ncbi:hypothetical protein BGZ81_008525 [Podila clonocystis]|nr:hypothetical protein BGZ81_008525 [Podila clonocystis]